MSHPDKTPADPGPPAAAEPPKPTAMLRWEQQIGYVMAGVAAAGSASAAAAGSRNLPLAGLAAGATALLVLAVRHGHRIITAAAGFLAGLVFSTFFFPLEVAFLFFSGYLMMRTSNAQAKIRRSQGPITAAQRRAAAEGRAAARARRRTGDTPASSTVKTPAANRRYTPPKGKPTRRP